MCFQDINYLHWPGIIFFFVYVSQHTWQLSENKILSSKLVDFCVRCHTQGMPKQPL